MEDEGSSIAVCLLRLQEMYWLFAPMSSRVQVVCCVVAIVEAKAVTLSYSQS